MYVGPWQEYAVMKKLQELKEENNRLLKEHARTNARGAGASGARSEVGSERLSTAQSVQSAPAAYNAMAARELLNQSKARGSGRAGLLRSVRQGNAGAEPKAAGAGTTGAQQGARPKRMGSASLDEQRRRRLQLSRMYAEEGGGGAPDHGGDDAAAAAESPPGPSQRSHGAPPTTQQGGGAARNQPESMAFDDAGIFGSSRPGSSGGGMGASRAQHGLLAGSVMQDLRRATQGAPGTHSGGAGPRYGDAALPGHSQQPVRRPPADVGGARRRPQDLAAAAIGGPVSYPAPPSAGGGGAGSKRPYDTGAPVRPPGALGAPPVSAIPHLHEVPLQQQQQHHHQHPPPPPWQGGGGAYSPKQLPPMGAASAGASLSARGEPADVPPVAPAMGGPTVGASIDAHSLAAQQQRELQALLDRHQKQQRQFLDTVNNSGAPTEGPQSSGGAGLGGTTSSLGASRGAAHAMSDLPPPSHGSGGLYQYQPPSPAQGAPVSPGQQRKVHGIGGDVDALSSLGGTYRDHGGGPAASSSSPTKRSSRPGSHRGRTGASPGGSVDMTRTGNSEDVGELLRWAQELNDGADAFDSPAWGAPSPGGAGRGTRGVALGQRSYFADSPGQSRGSDRGGGYF